MTHIPKEEWLKDSFASTKVDTELLRLPDASYQQLTPKEKDGLRQTEIFVGETVQVLGSSGDFKLVRKYDNTLGWVPSSNVATSFAKDFQLQMPPKSSPMDFLQKWLSVPYVWGGLSLKGIDCSGFSQQYFLQVHNILLPKNSFDQRKLGKARELKDIQSHDLIFCYHRELAATHHVVVYFEGQCWHARRKGGIVRQSLNEFLPEFKLEEVRSYLP